MLSSSRLAGRHASHNESPLSSSRAWTPLRENYFTLPTFSSRERAYFVRKSCEAALELVERARSIGGPMVWRHMEKHNGVQIYAGSPRSNATGTALSGAIMCGVTSVPGTIKEVASLFELGSTRQMQEFAQAHREWFYDGVVLHTLARRTKEKPLHQVTAKWMVIQMPHGVPHRDFCYLECQDKFIDAKGRKGWVLGQHSIKLPGCEDLKKEFGFVRGSMYNSGLVVVESEERPGHLDVIYLVQLNLKDHTSVPMGLLRARVLFVAQVRNMLRSKRLNEQRYLSDLELVPRRHRAKCAVCRDSFSLLLLRKMNCRKCGEVVCAACSKEFPIESYNFAATNGRDDVRKLRICMHCFQVITNTPKPTSALVEPPHSSTISMSFLGYKDDDCRASYMTSRVGGQHGHREEDVPKIYLQSMRHEKPSSRPMSSTLPIPGYGVNSRSRHYSRGEPDAELYQRSRHYQQQEYGHSHSRRGSQHMQSSDFRPSQSLSLGDSITRGEDRYTLQMPGPLSVSIFECSAINASQRPHHGLSRSSSSDMLGEAGSGNVSNFSRLQELSSRERLKQLQREDEFITRSGTQHCTPDAYMSALQQASRDKHGFDMPPPMCQAPPSDFGAYGATLDDHPVIPPDFGPYGSTLDDLDVPPLDLSALTTPTFPIELSSMSTEIMHPNAPRDGENEGKHLHLRGHEIQQGRESTSSDSSTSSIDIDTYEDSFKLAVAPPIPEQQYHEEGVERLLPKLASLNTTGMQERGASRESGKKAAWIYENDEDSETSMGASDDEEERCASGMEAPSLTTPPPYKPINDNAEETKAQEFAGSPALPAPSPSAHIATRKTLERPSIADMSIGSLSWDHALAEVKTTEGVKSNTIKEATTVARDLLDYDYQLQRSKVKGFADNEHNQMHVPPKQSKMQVTDDKQREGDTEADFLARKNTVPGRNKHVEDQDGIFLSQLNGRCAVPHTPSEISSTADQANGVCPPHERAATSPNSKCGKTPALAKHIRSNSREDTLGADDVEECQRPLNYSDDFANHVVLDAQKEASDMSSPTLESTSRSDDRFDTDANLGSTIVKGAALAGAQRGDETARPRVQGIVEHDQTTTFASPVIPMSVVLPANSEMMQTRGDDVLKSHLQTSGRGSFSSFLSSSACGSSICSTSLNPVTPLATPLSSATAVPASDLATSSPVRASDSSEVTMSQQRKMNTPPAYIPDRFRTTEQLQVVQQNVSTTNVPITTTPSSTPRQSSDSDATLDNFQLNFSASFDAHQQQKAQAVRLDDGLPQLMSSDELSRASSSGSNDGQVFRYQSVESSVLHTTPDTNVLSTSTGDSEDANTLFPARQLYGRSGNSTQPSRMAGDTRSDSSMR
ncbi:hypothetical protein DD237_002685 [Peronospora effusa]|uniref:FYVE-type domain-containing protein n=1 Tax=Peronospora effusa TaxID=542832 RepID=A0A425CDU2_9STRA|nr:hypothetical protein DD237_002685 [Peronospora effusa]